MISLRLTQWRSAYLFFTHLKPVNGALDVSQAEKQTIPLEKVDHGDPQLLSALVPAIDLLERLVPERERFRRWVASEAYRRNETAPNVIDDKVRRGRSAVPVLVEGAKLSLGVPAAFLARLGGLVVHGRAKRENAEDLLRWNGCV